MSSTDYGAPHLMTGSIYHYATVGLRTMNDFIRLGFETVQVLEDHSRIPVFYVMKLVNNFTTASYDRFECRVWVDARPQTAGAIIDNPIIMYELVPTYSGGTTHWERSYLSLVLDNFLDKKLPAQTTYYVLKYYKDKIDYGHDQDKYPWLKSWDNTLTYYISLLKDNYGDKIPLL